MCRLLNEVVLFFFLQCKNLSLHNAEMTWKRRQIHTCMFKPQRIGIHKTQVWTEIMTTKEKSLSLQKQSYLILSMDWNKRILYIFSVHADWIIYNAEWRGRMRVHSFFFITFLIKLISQYYHKYVFIQIKYVPVWVFPDEFSSTI